MERGSWEAAAAAAAAEAAASVCPSRRFFGACRVITCLSRLRSEAA